MQLGGAEIGFVRSAKRKRNLHRGMGAENGEQDLRIILR
jgi:hypothetical protein